MAEPAAADASGLVPWPDSAADAGGGGATAAGAAAAWEPLVAMRCTHEVTLTPTPTLTLTLTPAQAAGRACSSPEASSHRCAIA